MSEKVVMISVAQVRKRYQKELDKNRVLRETVDAELAAGKVVYQDHLMDIFDQLLVEYQARRFRTFLRAPKIIGEVLVVGLWEEKLAQELVKPFKFIKMDLNFDEFDISHIPDEDLVLQQDLLEINQLLCIHGLAVFELFVHRSHIKVSQKFPISVNTLLTLGVPFELKEIVDYEPDPEIDE